MADPTILIAFSAGLGSFIAPCILPMIPAFLAYISGTTLNEIKHKLWNGHDLKSKNILVVREQGAGDEILYSSMYGDIINLNKNVKIETDVRFLKLFKLKKGESYEKYG